MTVGKHSPDKLQSIIAETGADFRGAITLTDEQRKTVEKITGIKPTALQIGVVEKTGLVMAMPGAMCW